jgi:hypothetical protein
MAFETAQLASAQIKLDAMAADAVISKKYQPQVAGLRKIMQNQTATLNEAKTKLAQSDKNFGGKVFMNWITTDAIVEEAITPNCDLVEPKLDASATPFDLSMEFRTGFSIDEDEMKDTIYSPEELVANGMLKALQVMDEGYAKRAIAKLDAFAGTNAFLNGNVFANGQTTVAANLYNEKLFSYLVRAAEMNRLRNYYILDSGELFDLKFMAEINKENGEGKGLANLLNQFDISFDMVNFAKAAVTTDTLVVDRNSVAFVTRNRFQNTVPQGKVGQQRYKIASKALPGVFYDVYYKETCIAVGNKDHIVETFRLQTEGDLLKAPEITYPGVLAFAKGA